VDVSGGKVKLSRKNETSIKNVVNTNMIYIVA
jgi:hypothetical protein